MLSMYNIILKADFKELWIFISRYLKTRHIYLSAASLVLMFRLNFYHGHKANCFTTFVHYLIVSVSSVHQNHTYFRSQLVHVSFCHALGTQCNYRHVYILKATGSKSVVRDLNEVKNFLCRLLVDCYGTVVIFISFFLVGFFFY